MPVDLCPGCFAAAGGGRRRSFAASSFARQRAGAATPHGITSLINPTHPQTIQLHKHNLHLADEFT